ncbi:MAG: TIGR01906 family membrane protein [Oscillospiraceae bacterium]
MKKILIGAILSVSVLLLSISIGLGILHTADTLYRIDISALNIEQISGLPKEEILSNYHAVMNYLSPFEKGDFELPTLAYGEGSIRHFADVKNVFGLFYIMGACGLAAVIVLWLTKQINKKTLRISGCGVLLLPIALIVGVSMDFDASFIFFHSIFFEGSTWYLDPVTDPIINILPEQFFLHCALVIVACIISAAVMQFAIAAKCISKEG